MNNSIPEISESDFTSLYLADKASKAVQSSYLYIIAIDLFAMILASAIAIYNYQTTSSKTTLYVSSGCLLFLSLLLTIVLLTKKLKILGIKVVHLQNLVKL